MSNTEEKKRIPIDLSQLFPNTPHIGSTPEGAEHASVQYGKYGIYRDPSDRMEFLCVIMERDDMSKTPEAELTEDDYLQRSVMKYDFEQDDWVSEPGLMRMISSTSFQFIDEDEFATELLGHRETYQANNPNRPHFGSNGQDGQGSPDVA